MVIEVEMLENYVISFCLGIEVWTLFVKELLLPRNNCWVFILVLLKEN
jgi:hypothetical protein